MTCFNLSFFLGGGFRADDAVDDELKEGACLILFVPLSVSSLSRIISWRLGFMITFFFGFSRTAAAVVVAAGGIDSSSERGRGDESLNLNGGGTRLPLRFAVLLSEGEEDCAEGEEEEKLLLIRWLDDLEADDDVGSEYKLLMEASPTEEELLFDWSVCLEVDIDLIVTSSSYLSLLILDLVLGSE